MKKVILTAQSDSYAEQAYQFAVMEVGNQCMFADTAFSNITIKGEGEILLTFSSIHSFLTHCANISKILWSKKNKKKPDATLQEVIGQPVADRLRIGGSSPIKKMWYRDGLDHYDERIVTWVRDALDRRKNEKEIPIIELAVGKKNIEGAFYLRHYDPDSKIFTLMGKECNLNALHEEIIRIAKIVGTPRKIYSAM